ncbi:DNA-directed RNA polymerase subunit beta [Aneurinibacillus tyrosinisolvens]|uniref:DNA-directed RNA polymerase subunit beta n=1 Tax=Aneurinibacillus tyrosinisolvens TaxID=1443435 RepID=UPI00063ED6FC|nr:DNA-directed RNA polymerase subunit beta [Aneurinibacillus tyrosinisolvens]
MAEQPKQPQVVKTQGAAALKDSQTKTSDTSVTKRRKRRKGVPLFLKLILVPFLLFVALLAGMIAGYGVLGKGNALDVFNLNTWKHIYDLVFS